MHVVIRLTLPWSNGCPGLFYLHRQNPSIITDSLTEIGSGFLSLFLNSSFTEILNLTQVSWSTLRWDFIYTWGFLLGITIQAFNFSYLQCKTSEHLLPHFEPHSLKRWVTKPQILYCQAF